jgi:hypothetical protein
VNEIQLNKNTYLFPHRFLVGMVIVVNCNCLYIALVCVYVCDLYLLFIFYFSVFFLDNIVLFDEWSEFVMNLI